MKIYFRIQHSLILFLVLSSSFAQSANQIALTKTALTPVDRFGQLRVAGTKIVGETNEPVQLRGMSLFWSQWQGKYYTDETVNWLATDWKCNVIRAAMGIEHDGYLKHPQREKNKITTVIDAAIANGLYVIIDWHDHHGENHVKEAKAFFAEMAQRYGDKPNIIYEPYNEPIKVSWSSVLKPYFQEIIDTIRHYDPDNIIVCGTPTWSQDVDAAAADPLTDKNVAYTLHFYAATHKQSLRNKALHAMSKGLALMVTEFGTTEATGNGYIDETEMRTWFNFMDEHKLSWCNWSVADKKENSAALKPRTRVNNWSEENITFSGNMVRKELLAKSLE